MKINAGFFLKWFDAAMKLPSFRFIMQIVDGFIENSNTYIEKL